MAGELKPCPFCGNPPDRGGWFAVEFTIGCSECQFELSTYMFGEGSEDATKALAVKNWNRRAPVQP